MLLGLVVLWMMPGCGTDSTREITALQEKVAKVTQQLEETRKQVEGLQEANQRSVQAIENLTATVERLNVAAPAGKGPMKAFAEQDLPPSSKQRSAASGSPTIAALNASPSFPSVQDAAPRQEQTHPFVDKSQRTQESNPSKRVANAQISCSQVWKQLGQGKSAEDVAQALGSSVDAVHTCEQKIGRHAVNQ